MGTIGYNHTEEAKAKISASARRRFVAWIQGWLAGAIIATGRADCWRIRRFLLEQHGGCQRCGWAERNPVTNLIPVQLHHKDGDHSNNHIDNLELLCPNCHSLTPTFMALNKGTPQPGKRYN